MTWYSDLLKHTIKYCKLRYNKMIRCTSTFHIKSWVLGFYLTWLVYVLIIFRPRSCWVQRVRHYVQRYIPWWRPICARHTDRYLLNARFGFLRWFSYRDVGLDVFLDVQKIMLGIYDIAGKKWWMHGDPQITGESSTSAMVSQGEGLTSLSYHIDAGWSITMAWGFTNLGRTYQKMPSDSNFEVRSLEIRDRTW